MAAAGPNQPSDQLVLECGPTGETISHYLLLNGQGGDAIRQKTVPLAQFLKRAQSNYLAQAPRLFGLLPSGLTLRAVFERHGVTVCLIEVPWGVRTLRWLCDDSPHPYGPNATYRDVAIALPWQYFFVSVDTECTPTPLNSVYFMNQPLRSLTEPLCDCHYYNCSVDANSLHCWICTQYVDLLPPASLTIFDAVARFVEWFFASSFNASSEHHEGGSFWGINREHLGDARVATIAAWEKATARDPAFILTVPWRPSLSPIKVFMEVTPARSRQPAYLADLVRTVRSLPPLRGDTV